MSDLTVIRFNTNFTFICKFFLHFPFILKAKQKERGKPKMKKYFPLAAAFLLFVTISSACTVTEEEVRNFTVNSGNTTVFDPSREITVISRETGSGTRGSFTELLGIEVKDESGNKKDLTTPDAIISNSTSVVMTSVANNRYAIGYISSGSLNDTVKAVKVNGIEPTVENIKNGTYTISRPFNIVTAGNISDLTEDFISFILSSDGQKVIEENRYIPVSGSEKFTNSGLSGKITVAGSSSVAPVMEKLKEAYQRINPDADIEIQLSDSSTGINAVINRTCDIGMASRELKASELEKGLVSTVIAMDGIAVIVNTENPVDNLTTDQIKAIYTGEITRWNEVLN